MQCGTIQPVNLYPAKNKWIWTKNHTTHTEPCFHFRFSLSLSTASTQDMAWDRAPPGCSSAMYVLHLQPGSLTPSLLCSSTAQIFCLTTHAARFSCCNYLQILSRPLISNISHTSTFSLYFYERRQTPLCF